jgi:hypothetical protein
MGELGALFNPGMRHELEERRSKAMRREEEGNARDGDLRIDLESGVAVIAVDGEEGESASATEGDSDGSDIELADAGSDIELADAGSAVGDSTAVPVNAGSAVDDTAVPAEAASAAGAPGVGATESDRTAAEAASAEPPEAPAELRPRGKRGLAASRS